MVKEKNNFATEIVSEENMHRHDRRERLGAGQFCASKVKKLLG
jgi:hypothetical protein